MNIIDRALAVISPETAVRRLQARRALGILESLNARSYDGGKINRRNPKRAPATSANGAMNNADFVRVRDRARDFVRNSPHGSRAVEIFAANAIGTGIIPASRTGNKALDKKVNDLWAASCEEMDADGQSDWAGLQTLAARSMFEGGEALGRLRVRRESDGLKVPLQLQLMEGDHIDNSRHEGLAFGRTVLGVEFDGLGRRRGYYLFNQHPGEMTGFSMPGFTSQRVDAAEVIHLYRKLRIGQVRGVSAFAPVITTATDLRDMWEAIVIKSRIEACFAGFITSDETDGGAVGVDKSDGQGGVFREIEPGMMHRLKPGEDISFANPSATQNVDPLLIHSYMAMAVGTGLTLDQLTGDLRQANYSSLRAGKVEQRRLIEQFQYQGMITMFCKPFRRRWLEMAILAGKLKGKPEDYLCEWIVPSVEPIDPVKDLTADIMAVRSGRMTPQQFVGAWGNDFDTQVQDIAAANKLFDELGLTLDIDARKVSQAGLIQQQGQQEPAQAAPQP